VCADEEPKDEQKKKVVIFVRQQDVLGKLDRGK